MLATENTPKTMKDVVPTECLNFDRTILLEKAHRGLRAVPMSPTALTKLIIMERQGDTDKSSFKGAKATHIDDLLSWTNIVNSGPFIKGSPIVQKFSDMGLDLIF